MQEFERATGNIPDMDSVLKDFEADLNSRGEEYTEQNKESITALYKRLEKTPIFKNDTYTVMIDYSPEERDDVFFSPDTKGDFLHLSIKRNDKEAIFSFSDLSSIKNFLSGKENESFEIYPAESRKLDASNQYHLWVAKNPNTSMQIDICGSFDDAKKDGCVEIIDFSKKHCFYHDGKAVDYTVELNESPEKMSCFNLASWMEKQVSLVTVTIHSKKEIHDWRLLQHIKNEVVGENNEAIEFHYAESRVNSKTNQYHLWVLKDKDVQVGMGFIGGGVIEHDRDLPSLNFKQRPLSQPFSA